MSKDIWVQAFAALEDRYGRNPSESEVTDEIALMHDQAERAEEAAYEDRVIRDLYVNPWWPL